MVSRREKQVLDAAHDAITKSQEKHGKSVAFKATSEDKPEAKVTPAKKEKKPKAPKSKPKTRRLKLRANKRNKMLHALMAAKREEVGDVDETGTSTADSASSDDNSDTDNNKETRNVSFAEEPTANDDDNKDDNKEETKEETKDETKTPPTELKSALSKKSKTPKPTVEMNPTAVLAQTDKRQSAALVYVTTFCKDNDNWKFNKVMQMWLLRNMWFPNKVDDKHFKYVNKYIKKLGNHARRETMREARELMSRKVYKAAGDVSDPSISVTEDIFLRAESVVKVLEKAERKGR